MDDASDQIVPDQLLALKNEGVLEDEELFEVNTHWAPDANVAVIS